jgi:hypothetical protein
VSLGWSLVPVERQAKRPHKALLERLYDTTQWKHLKLAPALLCEVELWLEEEPAINIGVFPSPSLVVVDVDRLDLLDLAVVTPTSRSGRVQGGKHLFFEYDRALPMTKTPWGHLNPAYAVLPPSLHESGRAYQWLPGRSPDEVGLMGFADAAPLLGLERLC